MADYVPITDVMSHDHSSRVTQGDKARYSVSIAPLAITFPHDSYIRDINVTNDGWDKLTISRIMVIGPWKLLTDFDRIIYPGQSINLQVHYVPTSTAEDDRGGLFVDCSEAVGTKLVTLNGSGADENVPVVGPRTKFKIRRGINTDQWVIWTPADRWGDASAIIPFPEWRRHVTHATMYSLREAGLDFIRMPVDPSVFMADVSVPIREQLYQSVVESIEFLQSAGFKVIVDLHLIGGSRPTAPMMTDVFTNDTAWENYVLVVAEMARRIKKFMPEDVALELMNEPSAGGPQEWKTRWALTMQKRLYDTARGILPDHTLVLTPADGEAEHINTLNPNMYNDTNILWTFHSYKPFLVSHQGATWAGDVVSHVKNIPYPLWSVAPEVLEARLQEIYAEVRQTANPDRIDGIIWYIDNELHAIDTPAKLDVVANQPFDDMQTWARKYGINPANILLGEFGIIRQEYGTPYIVDPAQRASFYKDLITRAEFYGYPWAAWSFGGAFGIMEEFEYRPSEPNTFNMFKELHPIKI